MKVLTEAIVSNSKIIKNYKTCRETVESLGKIFILKNNQPDAVLFSIAEYEKLSVFIEYMESIEEKDIAKAMAPLPKIGYRKSYSMGLLRKDIDQIVAVDIIV